MHLNLLSIPQTWGKNVKTFGWDHIGCKDAALNSITKFCVLSSNAPIFAEERGRIVIGELRKAPHTREASTSFRSQIFVEDRKSLHADFQLRFVLKFEKLKYF